jgi:DNA polymerase-3 subunit delta
MSLKDYQSFKQKIKTGSIDQVYFLYGPEPFFIDSLAGLIEQHALQPGEEVFNKTIFYGKDTAVNLVTDQVMRFPMMAERQLVIVREAQSLKNLDTLTPVIQSPVKTTVLVLLYKKESIDRRQKIFKLITKNASVFHSTKIYENQVPEWIRTYAATKGKKLNPKSIRILVEYLGTDLQKIKNAIEQLAITYKSDEIPEGSIEEVIGISRSYNVFELQEALGTRNIPKILRITELMAAKSKENPLVMIIASLYNYYSKLYILKGIGAEQNAAAKKAIGISSDFIYQKYKKASKHFSIPNLEGIIEIIRSYDLKSKGMYAKETRQDEMIRELILRILNSAA